MEQLLKILMLGLVVLGFGAGASDAEPTHAGNAAFMRQDSRTTTPLPDESGVPGTSALPPEGGVPGARERRLQRAAPRIQFATTTNDFGRVIAGSVLQHDFIFTNTGRAPLLITEVKATCGCTTAGAWTRELLPGQTGVIPLQYQTPIVDTPTVKEATVTCNDPSQPVVRLELRATIWRPIALEPEMAVFTATNFEYAISDPELVALGTNGVRIINQEPQPLTLTALVGDNRLFAAELRTNVPGREYEVRLRLVPPLLGARRHSGYFTLQTSSTNQPVLRVKAYLQILVPPVRQTASPPVPAEEADWLTMPPEWGLPLKP